jgi:phosphoribosylformylglycinamidine synthase subunit PurL
MRSQIEEGLISACANVLDGGILCTLTEMASSSKNKVGASLNLHEKTGGLSLIKYLFSEDSGRFICTVSKEFSSKFIENAMQNNIILTNIGFTVKNITNNLFFTFRKKYIIIKKNLLTKTYFVYEQYI